MSSVFSKGGEGQYLMDFMDAVHKPIAITFHTVLPSPSPERIATIRALAERTTDIIVLTERSARILRGRINAIAEDKITVIPHGTHVVAWHDKELMKAKHGFQGRRVLSTFGL